MRERRPAGQDRSREREPLPAPAQTVPRSAYRAPRRRRPSGAPRRGRSHPRRRPEAADAGERGDGQQARGAGEEPTQKPRPHVRHGRRPRPATSSNVPHADEEEQEEVERPDDRRRAPTPIEAFRYPSTCAAIPGGIRAGCADMEDERAGDRMPVRRHGPPGDRVRALREPPVERDPGLLLAFFGRFDLAPSRPETRARRKRGSHRTRSRPPRRSRAGADRKALPRALRRSPGSSRSVVREPPRSAPTASAARIATSAVSAARAYPSTGTFFSSSSLATALGGRALRG